MGTYFCFLSLTTRNSKNSNTENINNNITNNTANNKNITNNTNTIYIKSQIKLVFRLKTCLIRWAENLTVLKGMNEVICVKEMNLHLVRFCLCQFVATLLFRGEEKPKLKFNVGGIVVCTK